MPLISGGNGPTSRSRPWRAEIHQAVMALPPEDRHDRAKVNEAVRRHQRDRRLGDRANSPRASKSAGAHSRAPRNIAGNIRARRPLFIRFVGALSEERTHC
jgi:hypothetical protein